MARSTRSDSLAFPSITLIAISYTPTGSRLFATYAECECVDLSADSNLLTLKIK